MSPLTQCVFLFPADQICCSFILRKSALRGEKTKKNCMTESMPKLFLPLPSLPMLPRGSPRCLHKALYPDPRQVPDFLQVLRCVLAHAVGGRGLCKFHLADDSTSLSLMTGLHRPTVSLIQDVAHPPSFTLGLLRPWEFMTSWFLLFLMTAHISRGYKR